MLDFARLWPPEVPTPGFKAGFLIRHLRGELVQSFPKPLCADAFSLFQTGDEAERKQNNQEVTEALVYLLKEVLPSLAAHLEAEITDPEDIRRTNLSAIMHEKGWYIYSPSHPLLTLLIFPQLSQCKRGQYPSPGSTVL